MVDQRCKYLKVIYMNHLREFQTRLLEIHLTAFKCFICRTCSLNLKPSHTPTPGLTSIGLIIANSSVSSSQDLSFTIYQGIDHMV